MSDDGRTEPPLAGDERATLAGFLGFFRETLAWKCAGLDAAGLAATLQSSAMTLGGMLKHVAMVEDYWCLYVVDGQEPAEPWASADWEADPDWEWHSATDHRPDELLELWKTSVARSQAVLDAAIDARSLDGFTIRPNRDGEQLSLRWIYLHLIEEYARHTGHADLLRESIDGEVGE